MKNVLKPLVTSVLIPLGSTAAAVAADTEIHKKILGSGTTTLIISNGEMEDIVKIVKSLLKLLKWVSETIQNEVKEQKGGFLGMLIGTLGVSLLGNMLTGKGINRAGEGMIRVGYGSEGSSIKKINSPLSFD